MHSEKLHAEISIKAPIDKVFNFITNPHNIPLVLPGLIENDNVPDLSLRKGDKFNFKYKLVGVVIEGITEVEEIVSPTIYNFSTSVGMVSHWKEQLSENGAITNLSLDVEYETPDSLIKKIKLELIKQMDQNEVKHFLQNIKLAVEISS
jgi:carbon monoxide dehydrogenase subunit G